MRKILVRLIGACVFFFGMNTLAGDFVCYEETSTTNHFVCGVHGNCTWWAAFKRIDLASAGITGNAGYWYENAKNLNFLVGPDPRNGAIAVLWINGDVINGHVAYVESINNNGSFNVSEMDFYGSLGSGNGVQYATYYPNSDGTYNRNGGSTRWTLKGFIYEKDPNTISGNQFTVRRVGNYAWHPADSSCINAKNWYGLNSDRKIVRTYDDSQVCQWIYETLYPQEVSYNALFGSANACYQ